MYMHISSISSVSQDICILYAATQKHFTTSHKHPFFLNYCLTYADAMWAYIPIDIHTYMYIYYTVMDNPFYEACGLMGWLAGSCLLRRLFASLDKESGEGGLMNSFAGAAIFVCKNFLKHLFAYLLACLSTSSAITATTNTNIQLCLWYVMCKCT